VADPIAKHGQVVSWKAEEVDRDTQAFELGLMEDVRADRLVTLDISLDLHTRIFLPACAAEHRKRLFIYTVVSFHLGLYVGVALFPIFSKAFRNFSNNAI
jgi:hypothetical protein